MPEGDTVWRTARTLHRQLSGRALTATDFRVPAFATIDLAGQDVVETVAYGKHLLTRIGTAYTLHTHLKMEGSWHLYAPDSRWSRPMHEARVILRTAERVAVGFALGVVDLLPRDQEHTAIGHLGPDLLGPGWDPEEAIRRLTAEPDRPFSEAILDQRNLAGIGNMYRSELCFLLGLHPDAPVASVPDLARAVARARSILEVNKERVEQSTTGDLRTGRRHWVYRRDRQPCRRCGTRIQVRSQGETTRERVIYWCPRCQAPPAGA